MIISLLAKNISVLKQITIFQSIEQNLTDRTAHVSGSELDYTMQKLRFLTNELVRFLHQPSPCLFTVGVKSNSSDRHKAVPSSVRKAKHSFVFPFFIFQD